MEKLDQKATLGLLVLLEQLALPVLLEHLVQLVHRGQKACKVYKAWKDQWARPVLAA